MNWCYWVVSVEIRMSLEQKVFLSVWNETTPTQENSVLSVNTVSCIVYMNISLF